MTLLLLALALATIPLRDEPPPPPAGDVIPLPDTPAPQVHVDAFERAVVVEVPRRGARAATAAARRAPRALCPDLEAQPTGFRLRCTSARITAHLVHRGRFALLEIAETPGLPSAGDDAPPLLGWEPRALRLGESCPGTAQEVRGECRLLEGDRAGARAAFEAVPEGEGRSHASLRLGDLAFAEGDRAQATALWQQVREGPWRRVAASRLCELEPACLSPKGVAEAFQTDGLPLPLLRDVRLRHARALAFLGRPGDAARLLASGQGATRTCRGASRLCQAIAVAALRAQDERPMDGILLWMALPEHEEGARTYEVELAVAEAARREGAPLFAANVLSTAARHVPRDRLEAHLLETAELYVAAGDQVRGGVVLEFARARMGGKLKGKRWAAVARAVARAPRPAPDTERGAGDQDEVGTLLARASQLSRSAQAFLQEGKGATP